MRHKALVAALISAAFVFSGLTAVSAQSALITRPAAEMFGFQPTYEFVGSGVHTGTGNHTQQAADLGTSADLLTWGRTYNSQDATVGVLGRGWTAAFSSSLATDTDGSVRFSGDDGRVLTFTADGAGYTRPSDLDATLTSLVGGGWSLRYRGGETWAFDATGRLTQRTREGQQAVLTRDGEGRLALISHSAGHSLSFTYGTTGRLVKVRADDGREISYEYSETGMLTGATSVDGTTTRYEYDTESLLHRVVGPDGVRVVTNTYDAQNRVRRQESAAGGSVELSYEDAVGRTTVVDSTGAGTWIYRHDQNGRPIEITDPATNVSTRTYTADGRISSVRTRGGLALALSYDGDGNLTRYVADGLVSTFAYDAQHRLTSATAPTAEVTTYEYSGDSRIPTTVTEPGGAVTRRTVVDGLVTQTTDPTGALTNYGYNSRRLMTSVTDPLGNVSRFEYDSAGRQSAVISPAGRAKRLSRDTAGRITVRREQSGAQTLYEYTPSGRLRHKTDSTGAVNRYDYNPAGQRSSSTDALGRSTTYTYNGNGEMTTATDPLGNLSRYDYDQHSRLRATTYQDGTITRLSYDAEGRVTERAEPTGTTASSYDARGNVLTTTDAVGAVTRYEYDNANRVIKVIDPLGAVWQTTYDAAGRVTSTIDPTGATTRYEYDAAGRLITLTNPLNHITRYRYDAAGRNTEIIDPMGGVTRHEYDIDGRRIAETSPAGLRTTFQYDEDGRTIAVTDPRGGVTRLEYSARGEQITDISPAGAVRRFRYDAAGQLVGTVDPNGHTATYTYNPAGRLTSITDGKGAVMTYNYDVAAGKRSFTDPLGRTTERTFDAAGRVTAITEPSGQITRQEYNAAGDLIRRVGADGTSVSYAYDAAGRRTSMTDPTGATRYAYDPAGRLLTATAPDGRTLAHRYDAASRLTELTYPNGQKVSYTYDANDRLTGVRDPVSGNVRYSFDADGRLLTESLPRDWERRYHYTGGLLTRFEDVRHGHRAQNTVLGLDADGRVISQTDGHRVLRYTYDAADQLLAVHDKGDQILEAGYDAAGNRTSIKRDGRLTRLSYDAADQLISSETGSKRTTYRYDPSGRLIEQSDHDDRMSLTYNAFGLPATWTFDRGHITQTRRFSYDGDDQLVGLTSTTEGSSGHPKTRTLRYRWSEIDTVPQILEQREDPQPGRNATCPNGSAAPDGGESRADANFVYGHDRLFADSPCDTATFVRDVFGSAIQTGDTKRWALSQEYDVFGAPKANDADSSGGGQPPQDPRFGYRGELAIGTLVHLRARTYDTAMGRFTARDPVATRAGQTDAVSPYAYANNSPINFTDPFGKFPIPDGLLGLILGLLPALAPGTPCPQVENTPAGKDKCFQGIILPTRGGFDGQEKALQGSWDELSKMWYARPSQGEKAAHAFTIDKLSEAKNSFWANLWGSNYGLNINVDWEVGPKSAGVKDRSDGVRIFAQEFFRIDIVTDETYIYELKRWNNGKGQEDVTRQLARYLRLGMEDWTIRFELGTDLRDWADGFEARRYEPWGWFRIPIKKESTDVIVWGGNEDGHVYFDEGELADESARKKWKQRVNRTRIPRVPPPRRR